MLKKREKIVSFRYNFSEYLSFASKYKFQFFVVFFSLFLIEAILVGEKYLFKVLLDKGTDFEKGILLLPEFTKSLLILFGIYIIIIISNVSARWIYEHFLILLETKLIMDLKIKYFNHIVGLDYAFHTSHKTGSLISRLGRGASAIERTTDSITFNFAPLVFQVFLISFTLFYLDITSSIIIFFIVLAFVLYCFYIQRLQIPSNVQKNVSEDIEKANIADIFTNIDTVKYFGKEKSIRNKFWKFADTTRKNMQAHWNYYRWLAAGQYAILGIGTISILYFSITRFLQNEITIGTLTFIYTSYLGLVPPLRGFVNGMKDFYRCMADFEDLFQYVRIKKQIIDINGAKELAISKGGIEFQNVSFNFGNRHIFKHLDLKIKPHEKVALVGHSGSGKTTLIKLLFRFYNIKGGQIFIDGKDIKNYKQESIRSAMSIVPQECILFDDTIYNNILFSRPNAKRNLVKRAIKFAQLDKIIHNFPQKENTVVGERGVKLSGGEKQRVSIARALLASKKVLVLDEATSSLDSQTEHDIQEALAKLMYGKTSLIIAHRLSTIMHCDRIIVLCRGQIVQEGTHKDLIEQNGEYKRLWNLQRGGYI